MEEKEKRTSKEEGSGYGLTADNDSCRLADSDSSEPTDSNIANRQTATVVDGNGQPNPIL